MTDSIILTTGRGQIDLLNPKPEDVSVDDMLRNLSRMYRFTGASPMTVLQHSLYVGGLTKTVEGYVHDLHEYCTGDVAAPLLERLVVNIADTLSENCQVSLQGSVQWRIQQAIEKRLNISVSRSFGALFAITRADTQSRELELALMADATQEYRRNLPEWVREILEATPEMAVQMFRQQLSRLGVEL
jgi:5'-deoxynucleotidase YfbR-like HD superfamily hydrolase